MGILSGRASFLRFKVSGAPPRKFDEEHLDKLDARKAGRQRLAAADGIEIGWTGGEHVLDVGWHPEKNIFGDAMHWGFRIDEDKLPKDLLDAYYRIEVQKLAGRNPSGFASARQRREAKEVAREDLEKEAEKSKLFVVKRKVIPVMWDRLSHEVLFGSANLGQIDRFCSLFEQTFQRELECMTAGPRSFLLAEARGQTRQVDDSALSAFIPGTHDAAAGVAWIADDSSRDFLGNEFLLWLWYQFDTVSDTIEALDGSHITGMLAGSLTLDCPRGASGQAAVTHEMPGKMPEALRAAQTGKLPRKVGLTLVRLNQQYEFSIDAETLAITGGKLPPPDEALEAGKTRGEERVSRIRGLIETFDLLYDAFGKLRLGRGWESELANMQKWLKK